MWFMVLFLVFLFVFDKKDGVWGDDLVLDYWVWDDLCIFFVNRMLRYFVLLIYWCIRDKFWFLVGDYFEEFVLLMFRRVYDYMVRELL